MKKNKNYLIQLYKKTTINDELGNNETYEAFLERQLLVKIKQVDNFKEFLKNKDLKLPSQKECLKMAYKLAVDIEPLVKITKEEENKALLLNEGDILPTEIIFYEDNLLNLIKYCQKVNDFKDE